MNRSEENPRRILDVDVREVSLVDQAANLRKFLIIKRFKEDKKMGVFEQEGIQGNAGLSDGIFDKFYTGVAEVEKVLPKTEAELSQFWESDIDTVTKKLPQDLANAISEVAKWMKRMSKMAGAPGNAIARVLTFLGKIVGGKYPYPKPVAKAEEILSVEEAKKSLSQDSVVAIDQLSQFLEMASGFPYPVSKSVDGVESIEIEKSVPVDIQNATKRVLKFLGQVVAGEYPYPLPERIVSKSNVKSTDDTESERPAVQVMDDGTVIVDGLAVTKGKRFTASRTTALKDVTMQLVKLIGEIGDGDTLKALTGALKALESSQEGLQMASTQKSQGDSVVATNKVATDDLKMLVEDLTKRLEEIEKTRQAPSVNDDETTRNREVQKGFWYPIIQ